MPTFIEIMESNNTLKLLFKVKPVGDRYYYDGDVREIWEFIYSKKLTILEMYKGLDFTKLYVETDSKAPAEPQWVSTADDA